MRRARAVLALAAAWVACGPVAAPPASPVPVNACPEYPCTAYDEPSPLAPATCSEGACITNSSMDLVLVISLPDASFFAPGRSFAISWSQLLTESASCGRGPPSCLMLHSLTTDTGSMVVSEGVATAPGIGETLNGGAGATLPVSVQYFPLWPYPLSTSPYVDAPTVGLPLLPIQGAVAFDVSRTPPGPGGGEAAVFTTQVPYDGSYERDVVPDDPAFPPVVTVTVGSSPVGPIQETSLDNSASHALTVTSSAPLAGYQAYVRDATTKRRLSSLTTFGPTAAASAVAYLNTYDPLPFKSRQSEIVLAPPAGAPVPSFTDPLVFAGPFAETYPALPSPVAVSGVVQDVNNTPIDADLVIDEATSSTGSLLTAAGVTNPHLHYETSVHAAGGSYTVLLPPGQYDVWIVPSASSGAGATSAPLGIQALAGPSPVAAGETLTAAATGTIRGSATVGGDRPLAGARVAALPSASLAPTTDPRRWPRAQTTTTANDGTFSLTVDPGVYDVLIEPADGTSFPVVTATAQTVAAAGTLNLEPISVPAPIALDVVLHDSGNNPVAGADVRAFATPATFSAPASGGPAPSVEIGHSVTDDTGHLRMFVLPPR